MTAAGGEEQGGEGQEEAEPLRALERIHDGLEGVARGEDATTGAGSAWLLSGSRPASSFPPVPGVEVSPGENPAPAAFLRFGAAIDDDSFGDAGNWMRGESLGETFERGEVLARRSLAGLDLHQHEVGSLLQDQVDLQAVAVAIEGKPWPAAAMEMSLGDLGHDPGLEEGSLQGVRLDLARAFDVEQARRQPGVVEVELGRLDETLAEIGEKRRQAEGDVARLQHRKPASRRGLGDAAVARQRGEVEDLPRAAGAEAEEGLEEQQVADLDELPDVTLDVGGDIVGKPFVSGQVPLVDPGIAALPKQRIEVRRRLGKTADLLQRERQQLRQGGAAGERLGHAADQRQVLGAGEQEPAGRWVFVHQALQIGKDLRHPLDLVKDDAVPVPGEESDRVLLGEFPLRRVLQGHVRPVGEGHAAESRLARLAWPRQSEDRIARGQVEETRLEEPLDHGSSLSDRADSKFNFQSARFQPPYFRTSRSTPRTNR